MTLTELHIKNKTGWLSGITIVGWWKFIHCYCHSTELGRSSQFNDPVFPHIIQKWAWNITSLFTYYAGRNNHIKKIVFWGHNDRVGRGATALKLKPDLKPKVPSVVRSYDRRFRRTVVQLYDSSKTQNGHNFCHRHARDLYFTFLEMAKKVFLVKFFCLDRESNPGPRWQTSNFGT